MTDYRFQTSNAPRLARPANLALQRGTMTRHLCLWIGNAFVVAMLALDLGALHRNTRMVSFGESITWTAVSQKIRATGVGCGSRLRETNRDPLNAPCHPKS